MAVFERLFSRLTYKMWRRPSFCTGWSDPDNSARSLVTIAIQHRSVDPSICLYNVETNETYRYYVTLTLGMGPFKCYVTLSPRKLDPHPPPRNANNVVPYTFVTLFSQKMWHPPPPSALRNTWMAPIWQQRTSLGLVPKVITVTMIRVIHPHHNATRRLRASVSNLRWKKTH